MTSLVCWRCLKQTARLQPLYPRLITVPQPSRLSFRAPCFPRLFSATASAQAAAKATGKSPIFGGPPKRGQRMSKRKKGSKKEETRGRRIATGERKAVRKRVVLSNTNAFEVHGLEEWQAENFTDPKLLGQMVGLPGTVVDSLRALEAFKPTQGWRFFRRPATLLRPQCAELAQGIEGIKASTKSETFRRIIIGERGSGKSVLLLQAMAMAFLRGWVVIHIPEAQDLTIAHTAYAPLVGTEPLQYTQNTYIAEMLGRIHKANTKVLGSLKVTQQHSLPFNIAPDASLDRLAELGSRDSDMAWPVFNALWSELTTTVNNQSQQRPPILFTLDGLAHVSRLSEYLAPNMHHIHAHDLAIVKHFMEHLSGMRPLPNGGMVLAADSQSNRPATHSLDLVIRHAQAATDDSPGSHSTGSGISTGEQFISDPLHPYTPLDPYVLSTLQNVPIMQLEGLSRSEARTLLEYYAASGLLAKAVTDELVAEQWVLAGRGVVGEFERSLV